MQIVDSGITGLLQKELCNVIAATRLTNNAVSANMELFSTALQQTKDNSKEFSRISVNAAKAFNESTNDIATSASYSMGSARQKRQ